MTFIHNVSTFFIVSLPRKFNSNMRTDYNNKINVLPQLSAPSLVVKLPRTIDLKEHI
jgi:hypothetical protein